MQIPLPKSSCFSVSLDQIQKASHSSRPLCISAPRLLPSLAMSLISKTLRVISYACSRSAAVPITALPLCVLLQLRLLFMSSQMASKCICLLSSYVHCLFTHPKCQVKSLSRPVVCPYSLTTLILLSWYDVKALYSHFKPVFISGISISFILSLSFLFVCLAGFFFLCQIWFLKGRVFWIIRHFSRIELGNLM